MNEAFDQILGYVRAIWRRWTLVLIIAWLVSISGWVWVYILENQYQAQARVFVDTQSLLRPLLTGLAVQPDINQQVKMMTRTLMSRPNLEKIARMTDMDIGAKTPKQQEEMYKDIESRVSLAGTERENLYTIAYRHSSPDLSKRVVQAFLTIFTESSLGGTRQDISSSQKFIDDQLKGYEAKLIEKEKALEEFKRRHVGNMPGQGTGDYYSRVAEINAAHEQASLELEEAVNRKRQLEEQLADQEETVSAPTYSAPLSSPLDARIASLQTSLDNLRLRFTDLHPDIARTKQLIARLEEQKQQEIKTQQSMQSPEATKAQNPIYQQLTIAIAEADAQMASLRARVDQIRKKRAELITAVDEIPRVESEYTQLTRDYDVLKQSYADLLSRRETASISSDVESKTDTLEFRVIDPPRVQSKPVSPNRPLLVTAVPFLGIGLGVAVAFLLAQLRPTIDGRKQLREITSHVVLGVISKVTTEIENARARRRLILYGVATTALFGIYLAQLVYYLFVSQAA